MSQHFYNTLYQNRPIEIVIGWDRPLQYYFMWIKFLDVGEDEEEDFLWNSIDVEDGYSKEMNLILEVLNRYKLEIPSTMIRSVEEDGLKNEGNKQTIHVQPFEIQQSNLNDFNISDAYHDLVCMTQVIVEVVITGISSEKITQSNPDSLQYIDFEGEGLMLDVEDELSGLTRDLKNNTGSDHDFKSHKMIKYVLIKIYKELENLGGHESGQVSWHIEDADYFDEDEPCTPDGNEERLIWNESKEATNLVNNQKNEGDFFDLNAAYRELIEIIYSIIYMLGKAVKRIYFAKDEMDYLTSAHGEFILKRATEILCDDELKNKSSDQKSKVDEKIYLMLHRRVTIFLKAISEILDSEKLLSSCSLF